MAQIKRENEQMKCECSHLTQDLKSLQDKLNQQTIYLSENNKKMKEEFDNKVEVLKTHSENNIKQSITEPIKKSNENSASIRLLEAQSSKCNSVLTKLQETVDSEKENLHAVRKQVETLLTKVNHVSTKLDEVEFERQADKDKSLQQRSTLISTINKANKQLATQISDVSKTLGKFEEHCNAQISTLSKTDTKLNEDVKKLTESLASDLLILEVRTDHKIKDLMKEPTQQINALSVEFGELVDNADESDVQDVIDEVKIMLLDNEDNETIIEYINENLEDFERSDEFTTGLISLIAGTSVAGDIRLIREEIKARKDILQQYINTPLRELQALYAIQDLIHRLEHPSGVTFALFYVLYDEDVISRDMFKCWKKPSRTAEAEGKDDCFAALTRFFSWLG
ncbi:interaptin-like [Physella acuta]|uniref:interaptin-like n=1 Tax=Physella acuta TaxID=109671 RepID=UPI0027DC42CC|nr:interaptin-like [Physella acuta]